MSTSLFRGTLRICPSLPTISLVAPLPQVNSVRTHLGYIPYEGRLERRKTNSQKFIAEAQRANLQPVTKVTYSFDPIRADHHSVRNFMFWYNKPKVLATNLKLLVKTEIRDDRQAPRVVFDLVDGRQLEIHTSLLTELEIARVANQYILPLVKEEVAAVETKSAKAAAGGKKKGGKK